MNDTNTQIIDLPQNPGASPAPTLKSPSGHTRIGKVARLPKPIRDHLDQLIEDGLTCDQIKDTLGDPAKELTPNNISEWKKGGHIDWRNNQLWRQELTLRQEAFTDILTGADPVKLPEAGLQLITTTLCELLRQSFQPDSDDPQTRVQKQVRIASALSRVSRSILQLQLYRDAVAQTIQAQLKNRNPDEDLSDNELEILTARMDRVFRRPRHPKPPATPASPLPPGPAPASPVLAPAHPVLAPAPPVVVPASPVVAPAPPVVAPQPTLLASEPSVVPPASPVVAPAGAVVAPASSSPDAIATDPTLAKNIVPAPSDPPSPTTTPFVPGAPLQPQQPP